MLLTKLLEENAEIECVVTNTVKDVLDEGKEENAETYVVDADTVKNALDDGCLLPEVVFVSLHPPANVEVVDDLYETEVEVTDIKENPGHVVLTSCW